MTLNPPLVHVKLSPYNWPVDMVASVYKFDLNAPYQRGSVWTDTQRRALIESLLSGLPTGSIIVVETHDYSTPDAPTWRVIDGKQRIEAVKAFLADRVHVPGWWFPGDHLNDPDDRGNVVVHSSLSPAGQRKFANSPFPALSLDSRTEWSRVPPGTGTHGAAKAYTVRTRTIDERLAYEAHVFGLINSAGTNQTPETLAAAAAIAAGATS